MRYDIRLAIDFTYGAPAAGGRHHLRMLPLAIPGEQRVLAAALEVDPAPAERGGFFDFFGNRVDEIALPRGHAAARFLARAQVERLAAPAGPDRSVPPARIAAEAAAVASLAPDAPAHFLPPSPRIAPDPAIAAFAREAAAGAPTVFAAAAAFGAALHGAMRFRPGATTVDTPPARAFAARAGVCQDFAQIMIAGLRALGIPAAYVSGFLRTRPPPGQPRLEGADAMHAWVRLWGGRAAGWSAYDPTNACVPGAGHILVAVGRDYGDVAPVRGVLRSAGGQASRQAVDVVPLDP